MPCAPVDRVRYPSLISPQDSAVTPTTLWALSTMFSSLGFDSKNSPRNARNNSKYVLEVPRGFSVHVFKSPSPPAFAPNGAVKPEYTPSRTQPTPPWKTPSNAYTPRPDASRKPSLGWNSSADYDRALELDRSKSHKPYGIYPGTVPDTYIYERSISSMSDLPGSPSSSSSSDSDSTDTASAFALEVSSIRASSSTETLEATAYALTNRDVSTGASPYGQTLRAPPSRPVVPPGVVPPSNTSVSPARQTALDVVDQSEEGTVVDEYDTPRPNMARNDPPVRRNSDERSARGIQAPRIETSLSRPGSQSRSRSTSPTGHGADTDPSLRLPPGLHYNPPVPPHVGHPIAHRATVSIPVTRPPPTVPEAALSRVVSNPEGATSPNGKRCVRWTEDLICPSPVPPGQRRKGWFNRRGDQLWTNDGKYKSPPAGQEYPPDLACYPEPNAGWMNEEGTRIDLQHRLIPKPPLRPALKRPKSTPPEHILINTPSATP